MVPDDNDIIYTQYSPDFLGFIRRVAELVSGSDVSADSFVALLLKIWEVWSFIAFALSALFIYGIIYSYIRFNQYSEEDTNRIAEEEKRWKERHGQAKGDRRWSEIQAHISSDNPNDWKLSIIEADIILGEILHAAGYAGNSIGEQLKSASHSNFKTVQDAWDAHLIRNKIAHEGADFILTHAMAKEAIIKYQRVFKEFEVV